MEPAFSTQTPFCLKNGRTKERVLNMLFCIFCKTTIFCILSPNAYQALNIYIKTKRSMTIAKKLLVMLLTRKSSSYLKAVQALFRLSVRLYSDTLSGGWCYVRSNDRIILPYGYFTEIP